MMRKYWIMLLGLTATSISAYALTANEQMNAMKALYIKEFNQIDTDKDGKISKEEYIAYQFDNLRANILSETDGEETKVTVSETVTESKTEPDIEKMADVPAAMQAMADFDLDMDDVSTPTDISVQEDIDLNFDEPSLKIEETEIVTTPQQPELDLSVSEDENFKNLLQEMDNETSANATKQEVSDAVNDQLNVDMGDKDTQISLMMSTIRKTLPKKIDAITTWTDIEYKNSTISYIYQADIDTSKFSDSEKASLEMNIKNDACVKAYADMCPKVKPMFIDDGINVEIRYYDNNNKELSSCKFNKETCQD